MTQRPGEPEDVAARLLAYAPRVYGLLVRMVGRRDVAEDLLQETMLRALGAAERYNDQGKFRGWLFRIAANQARDWIRRRGRAPLAEADAPPPTDPVRPDEAALRRERARCVEEALARLAEPDREVLLMRYYGEMTFKEIAEAKGEPLGTVLARAHRALKKLGALMPREVS